MTVPSKIYRGSTLIYGIDDEPPAPTGTAAMWWAGDLALTDGDLVSTWTDRVNSIALTASTTARPTYRGGLTRPFVEFNGTSNILTYTASNAVTTASSGSVIAVCAVPDTASAHAIWHTSDGAGTTNYAAGFVAAGQFRVQVAESAAANSVYVAPTPARTIWEWSSNGSAWAIRRNNTSQSVSVNGSNTGRWLGGVSGRDHFAIGAAKTNSTGNYMPGAVSFLAVINGAMSSGERTALYDWLSRHYAV